MFSSSPFFSTSAPSPPTRGSLRSCLRPKTLAMKPQWPCLLFPKDPLTQKCLLLPSILSSHELKLFPFFKKKNLFSFEKIRGQLNLSKSLVGEISRKKDKGQRILNLPNPVPARERPANMTVSLTAPLPLALASY